MIHTLTLVATNAAGTAEADTSVSVAEPPPTGFPLWLQGVPINQWMQIPNTRLVDGDLSLLASIPGAEKGLADAKYGKPVQENGINGQSGGTFRKAGSELLLTGGGGAGCWAGNDIRGLRLEDDAPKWMVRSPPAADYWPRNDAVPAHAYTQSSKQPNNGHSYWQPQFCDATDKFFRITHYQTWENDTAPIPGVNYVHRLDWATKQWALSDDTSRSPDLPTDAKTGWDGAWCCKHPVSEQIYRPTQFLIHRFDPKGNGGIGIWYSWQYSSANPGVDRGTGCVDPDHELILVIGRRPVDQLDHKPIVYDISSGKPYAVTNNAIFTGPYAASIRNYNQVWGAGMVWDAGLHCFLWYQNDSYVYTIKRGATNAEWIVDRLPLTGTPPAANVDYTYGRMQYAPNLKGVVMMLRADNNCWFIRTS